MASQIVSGQGLNFGKIAQAGLIGAVTAGLTNGITFDGNSFGLSEWGQSLKGTNTLANLAGSNTAGGVLQAAKDGATGSIYQQAIGMVGTGLINAGVNTAFNGGSFGQAFLNNLVTQAAALGAHEIGNSTDPLTLQNIASHAALGCAAQSAMGGDCAGGAIGGATSAVVAPLVRDGLYDGSQSVTKTENSNGTQTTSYNNLGYNAATVAIAMLAGGGLASALGQNATTAAGAAQNEALNNSLSGKQTKQKNQDLAAANTPADKLAVINQWDRVDQAQGKVFTDLTDAKDALASATTPDEKSAALQKLQQAVDKASAQYKQFQAAGDSGGANSVGAALLSASLEIQRNGGTLTAEQRQSLAQTLSQVGTALGAYEGSLFSGNTNLARAIQGLVGGTASGAVGTSSSTVATYGPTNPGPLSQDIANTFRSGTYTEMLVSTSREPL